jgi:putative sterol carrier protein
MADAFEPDKALGFSGDLRYELRATDGTVRTWTVRVDGDRATARPGGDGPAALTLRLAVADFVRMAGRDLDPGKALLSGRLDLEGDFALAARLGEMFGQPSAI